MYGGNQSISGFAGFGFAGWLDEWTDPELAEQHQFAGYRSAKHVRSFQGPDCIGLELRERGRALLKRECFGCPVALRRIENQWLVDCHHTPDTVWQFRLAARQMLGIFYASRRPGRMQIVDDRFQLTDLPKSDVQKCYGHLMRSTVGTVAKPD